MTQKIWVITELYYPEDTSTGYFLTQIAEGLAIDFDVHVLATQPTYSARGVRAPAFEKLNGVQVYRCPSTTLNKDILLFKLINLITVSASIFVQSVLRMKKGDLALVVTNPPLLPFLTMLACRLRGLKMVLLIHDVYPDVMVLAGLISPDGILARIIEWFTRGLYRSCEVIVTLGRDMQALVDKKMGSPSLPGKVVVITNWGDVEHIVPMSKQENDLIEKLGLSDKFVIQYSGNMGRTHGLEVLLETAKHLKNEKLIHFLIIGSGAKQKWVQVEARKSKMENVTLLPYLPRNELNISLSACDLAVITFIGNMAGVSVPSRMYNILAAGRPIVAAADSDSELAMVIGEERIGWVVPPDSPEELHKAILEAYQNPDRLQEMGSQARALVERKYSLKLVIDEYCQLFSGLSKGSNKHESQSVACNRS
jgi:colanic acid biosynthesis glycosyl transferase WcaI